MPNRSLQWFVAATNNMSYIQYFPEPLTENITLGPDRRISNSPQGTPPLLIVILLGLLGCVLKTFIDFMFAFILCINITILHASCYFTTTTML